MQFGARSLAWILLLSPMMAAAEAPPTLPPDPQRPIHAATCAEALDRVEEAASGSPLISSEENKDMLRLVLKRARELCLTSK